MSMVSLLPEMSVAESNQHLGLDAALENIKRPSHISPQAPQLFHVEFHHHLM